MNPKLLLAGACASALLAGPAFAQDATSTPSAKHRHHTAVNSVEQRLDRLERVIEEQQGEIRSLKSQLGVQGGSSGGAGSVAASTPPQPQPEVSAAQFQALQTQVNQQQAEVETVTKPKDKKVHFKVSRSHSAGSWRRNSCIARARNSPTSGRAIAAFPIPTVRRPMPTSFA